MKKKIIGIFLCILLIGISILPGISGNIKEIGDTKETNSLGSLSSNLDVIFHDDFNDNTKDYSKWTEIYNDGVWEEINSRCEFEVYEPGSGDHLQGIKSTSFSISLNPDTPLIINWDLIADIQSTNWAGDVRLEISDGANWIVAVYSRYLEATRYRDSNDGSWTYLNNNKPYGTWNNEIQLYSDEYIVRMDSDSSGPIIDTIFSPNPQLFVIIYLFSSGSQPSLYYRSGFDNVMVQGSSSGDDDDDDNNDDDNNDDYVNYPPSVRITYPQNGESVNGTITFSGTAFDPNGDRIDWVMLNIDSTGWMEADGTSSWSYEWDSTTVEDGSHTLSVICYDGNLQSPSATMVFYVDNIEDPEPPVKYPDLECTGSLQWIDITPKLVISGEFTIENVGDSETGLDWEISDIPDWGNWSFTPSEGHDLYPVSGEITVDVLVVAPEEKNQNFTGEIKIVNMENASDYETIAVSLSTSKNKALSSPFIQFLENHPRLFPFLRQLLGLY